MDSHLGLPLVDKSLDALEQCELIPFRAAIDAGIDAIMTTHILFPQLEKEKVPATMSRAIMTGLLREKLGFEGLIISDCMMMGAIQKYYGTVPGCIAACKAGVDMVIISHDAALAGQTAEALCAELTQGRLAAEEMEASMARIARLQIRAEGFRSGGRGVRRLPGAPRPRPRPASGGRDPRRSLRRAARAG